MLLGVRPAEGQRPDSVAQRPAVAAPEAQVGIAPDCRHLAPVAGVGVAADSICVTRSEAITAALVRNPQLVAAWEQVAQAQARKVQGTAIPDPSLDLSVSEATRVFGGSAKDQILGATLQVPFPDKFRLRGRIGNADIQTTTAGLQSLRLDIATQTSQAYDSLLAALRHQRDLQVARALTEAFLAKTQARFEAGTAPKLDVIRARVDLAQAENDLIANGRDIFNARAALNRLLDRPLGALLTVSDTLALPPELPPLEALESAALASRPELVGLQRQQEGARATTALAKEYWLPDIIFGLSHNYADPGPGILVAGLSMPLPVFFWQHTNGEIAESAHREQELVAAYRDLKAQVGQDVRTAYAAAATALRQAAYLRDQLLPAAREAYRVASVSYSLGGSSALEVLDARRALRDAESQYTDALAAANTSWADLQRAIAAPLEPPAQGGPREH